MPESTVDPQAQDKMSAASDEEIKTETYTVLIHNGCASKRCEDPQANGLSCELLKISHRDDLKDDIQAYDWTPERAMTANEIEHLLSGSAEDDSCVVGVSRSKEYKLNGFTSNDPAANRQYFHETIKGLQSYTYFRGQGYPSVRVGIVDSGVDFASTEMLSGYNTNQSTDCPTAICNFHGTFVAGIIAARTNNSQGGYGVTTNSYIVSIQIGDAEGRLRTSEIVNAITTASNNNIEILNLSLGGGGFFDFSFQDAMLKAIQKNILVVVAAGNNGRDISKIPFYPASFNLEGQINVGSASPVAVSDTAEPPYNVTGSPIKRDSYSNYGKTVVDIAAPGRRIYSTTHGNGFAVASGTSFSAPMVTAAAVIARGALKKAGLTPTPQLLKQLILEGTRREDPMSETIGGVLTEPFAGNRYLDLEKLKQTLESYTAMVAAAPAQLSILSSERLTVGGQQIIRVRVQVNNADPNAGLTIKSYSNSAFIPESDTGASCTITMAVQICQLDVSYNSLMVDPELYLRVVNPGGLQVSDLKIPKTSLNFGVRAAAALKGEIVQVNSDRGVVNVEGWACLVGFPDAARIEVRLGTTTGDPIDSFPVHQQARGNYFTECNAPEITFGFNYSVPPSLVPTSGERLLYFRAVHEETGKTLDLPVYQYQPGFMDPTPAVFQTHVRLDPAVRDLTPTVNITKYDFKNWILTVEGTACFTQSRKPASFSLGLRASNLEALLADLEPWNKLNLSTGGLAAEPVSASGSSAGWTVTNPAKRVVDKAAWAHTFDAPFSEIHYPLHFIDNNNESKPYLIQKNEHFMTDISLKTITPSIEKNDGCATPSGFAEAIDIRPWIDHVTVGFSFIWNKAHYSSLDEVVALNGGQKLIQVAKGPARTFSQLNFSRRAFIPVMAFNQGKFVRHLSTSIRAAQYIGMSMSPGLTPGIQQARSVFPQAFDSHQEVRSPMHSNAGVPYGNESNAPSVYNVDFQTKPTYASSLAIKDGPFWGGGIDVRLLPSGATALSTVYLSPEITLPVANSTRLIVAIGYSAEKKTGYLGEDFIVEMKNPVRGTWHEVPVDANNNVLTADFELDQPISTTQIRIRANGKNEFNLNRIGIFSE